ncbi:MAG: PAS domain S-box protein, partial [Hylemonella sp.]
MNPPQSNQASTQTLIQASAGKLPDHALSQRSAWLAMLLGTLLLAWLAAGLLRWPGNVAQVWFANAWAVAIYLSRPASDRAPLMALQALANLLWNWLHGDPTVLIIGFALSNVVEAVLTATLWRHFFNARQLSEQPLQFFKSLLLCGLLPALVGASLGAGLLGATGTAPFALVWPGWFLGDLFGYLSLVSAMNLFLYHRTVQALPLPRPWHYALLAAVLLAIHGVMTNFEQPYVLAMALFSLMLLTTPLLMAAAIACLAVLTDLHLAVHWLKDFDLGQFGNPVQDMLPGLTMLFGLSLALSYVRSNQFHEKELAATIQDLEETAQTAADLLKTRDGLLLSAQIGFAFVSNRTVRWCNLEFAELLGYSLSEMAGKTASDVFASPEEAERVGALIYPKVQEGATGEALARMRRKNGSECVVLVRGFRPNPQRDLTCFAVLDMTEREAQAQAVAELQKEQQLILDTANVGLARVRERKLVWVNRRCAELLGYTQQELQGQ